MATKERACKECGCITTEQQCPVCNNQSFVEKFKGIVTVLNARDSDVAVKLGIRENGKYALKYN